MQLVIRMWSHWKCWRNNKIISRSVPFNVRYAYRSGNAFLQIHSTYICICSSLYLDVVSISSCRRCTCVYIRVYTDVRSFARLAYDRTFYGEILAAYNAFEHTYTRIRVIVLYLFATNTGYGARAHVVNVWRKLEVCSEGIVLRIVDERMNIYE